MNDVIIVIFALVTHVEPLPSKIRIGGLFDSVDEAQVIAFKSAIERINRNDNLLPNSKLIPQIERIPRQDSFEASRRVCSLMSSGVAAIFGPQSTSTAFHVQSICDAFEIPHVDTRGSSGIEQNIGSINLYPHPPTLSKAYEDLVRQWNWREFAIVYENNDGLVRLKDLFWTKPRTVFSIAVRQLPADDNYRDVLRQIKKLEYTKIIVDCSTDKVFRVLKQAQQVGMITDRHHYLFTSLDMDTVDLEDFRYGYTKITSLRLVDPSRPEVVKVVNSMGDKRTVGLAGESQHFMLKTETALIFDAVYLFAKALHDLDSGLHIDIKPLSCESENTWVSGDSLINYMKVVQMKGLSGIVGFDTNGFRSYFDLDIMNLNSSGLQRVGYWSSHYKDKKFIGLHVEDKIIESGQSAAPVLNFTIATVLNDPYVMLKDSQDPQTGNSQYEGFCVDLIDRIAQIVKFNYTIYPVADNTAGQYSAATGEWDGIIGEIIKGKADIGIGDISITEKRESVVDFTTPFMNLGISILFQKPKALPPSLLSFLAPFSNDVWVYMCVTYVGVSLILFILARLSPYEWDSPYPCIQEPDVMHNDFGLMNSMWFTIGSLMQQGSDIAPKAASTRIVSGMWWLFTLIMISSYTANLAAFLTIETRESPIKSVNDLAKQTTIKYGCYHSGATKAFFESSKDPMYQQMWSFMTSMKPSVFTQTPHEGVSRVLTGGYAYFMESNSIEYITERDCNLTQVGGMLDNKGYGIVLNKNSSQYRNMISAAILCLQENGDIQFLKKKWWKQKRGGGKCKVGSSSKIRALGLPNVGGIFFVLLGGLALACVAAAVEFVWKTHSVASRERGTLCHEMMKEFKFVVSCKNSKKVSKKRPSERDNGGLAAVPLSKYSFNDRDIFSYNS